MFTNELDEIPNEGPSPHLVMENIDVTTSGITMQSAPNLDVHKASGPDDISTRFLKETAEIVAPVLKVMFERSLDTSDAPYDWRVVNVASIYKKENDQPPELSPNLTYIYTLQIFLEHIICSPLMKHFKNNNLLYEFQHEFRSNKSCDMQLISFF